MGDRLLGGGCLGFWAGCREGPVSICHHLVALASPTQNCGSALGTLFGKHVGRVSLHSFTYRVVKCLKTAGLSIFVWLGWSGAGRRRLAGLLASASGAALLRGGISGVHAGVLRVVVSVANAFHESILRDAHPSDAARDCCVVFLSGMPFGGRVEDRMLLALDREGLCEVMWLPTRSVCGRCAVGVSCDLGASAVGFADVIRVGDATVACGASADTCGDDDSNG